MAEETSESWTEPFSFLAMFAILWLLVWIGFKCAHCHTTVAAADKPERVRVVWTTQKR